MISARCPILSGVALATLASLMPACKKDELQGAKAEVEETSIKLDLPPVPDFAAPAPNSDGTHSVQEMRLKGNKFVDAAVRVKGHVIWIYDCATAIRTPDMADAALKKLMADEPERCSRPNFYLGDTPDTAPDKGIWVVEVPRLPRPDEKKADPEGSKALEAAFKAVPPYKVGDQVMVSGTWALTSPKGFRNSDGLLVFGTMENVSTGVAGTPPPAPPADAPK
jgi:hypothetical protein